MSQHRSGRAAASPDVRTFSNAVRLNGWEWLGVGMFALAMIVFTPSLWERIEHFDPDPDYRMPYNWDRDSPSSDYWHYNRYTQIAAARDDTVLIGDSVFWGHYVAPQQTLSHYLNNLASEPRFANLGLHGIHPVALAGLLEYYAVGVTDRNVLLHWNPLWHTSPRTELQDEEYRSFNHPRLVPQFLPDILCYKEVEVSTKLGVLVERRVPFLSWNSHLQQAYFDQNDIPSWTLEHPYDDPLKPLLQGLPPPDNRLPARREIQRTDYPWGDPDASLQWRFFRKSVGILQQRGNRVFVLVGPFNEHMLTRDSLQRYRRVHATVVEWLKAQGVAYAAPPPPPPEEYADASHPLAPGYQRLARQLYPELPWRSSRRSGE
jgi:hypothetical protein